MSTIEREPTGRTYTRKQVLVRGGATVGVLGLGPLLAACGGGDAQGEPDGGAPVSGGGPTGEAVFAAEAEAENLNPQLLDSSSNFTELININEPLLERNADGELKGLLAESWEPAGDNAWRIKVRSGVKFHNDEDFNAEAAAYTLNRVVDPDFGSAMATIFGTIKRARALDETTVEVRTNGPDPILPARLAFIQVVPPEASQRPDFGDNPVGTGPYRFVEWRRGQEVRMTAFDGYWGGNPDEGLNGKPSIKDVVFRVYQEPEARFAALMAGEVDIVRGIFHEQAEQVPQVEELLPPEYAFIRLHNQADIFKDPRVRQAANYAVDKQGIIDSIFGGKARLLDAQFQGPEVFGYNPDLEPYPFDPAKAKELAQAAGAEKISFEILGDATGHWPRDRELVQAVAAQLSQNLGWDVKPRLMDWTQFVDYLWGSQGTQPAAVVYSGNDFLDADRNCSSFLLCDAPASGYCNPDIGKKLNAARRELDADKRETMYHEVLEYVGMDDPCGIFLVQPADIYGLSERITFKPRPDRRIVFANAQIAS